MKIFGTKELQFTGKKSVANFLPPMDCLSAFRSAERVITE